MSELQCNICNQMTKRKVHGEGTESCPRHHASGCPSCVPLLQLYTNSTHFLSKSFFLVASMLRLRRKALSFYDFQTLLCSLQLRKKSMNSWILIKSFCVENIQLTGVFLQLFLCQALCSAFYIYSSSLTLLAESLSWGTSFHFLGCFAITALLSLLEILEVKAPLLYCIILVFCRLLLVKAKTLILLNRHEKHLSTTDLSTQPPIHSIIRYCLLRVILWQALS